MSLIRRRTTMSPGPSELVCVRHAQGYHNISVANHAMHDPQLTPVGEEQCRILQRSFPRMMDVECIVASPLKRTIYTALLSFAPVIEAKKLKVIALPELQETSDLPCDTGSNVEELEKEFKGKPVDFSLLHQEGNANWNNKQGRWAPTATAIEARAADARYWLYSRQEKEVVCVTHGGFLHYFTQDWSDTHKLDGTPSAGTGWANTEYRAYLFDSANGEINLIETPESRKKRAGDTKPLTKEEQKNMQRSQQAQWDEQEKKERDYQRAAGIQAKV